MRCNVSSMQRRATAEAVTTEATRLTVSQARAILTDGDARVRDVVIAGGLLAFQGRPA